MKLRAVEYVLFKNPIRRIMSAVVLTGFDIVLLPVLRWWIEHSPALLERGDILVNQVVSILNLLAVMMFTGIMMLILAYAVDLILGSWENY